MASVGDLVANRCVVRVGTTAILATEAARTSSASTAVMTTECLAFRLFNPSPSSPTKGASCGAEGASGTVYRKPGSRRPECNSGPTAFISSQMTTRLAWTGRSSCLVLDPCSVRRDQPSLWAPEDVYAHVRGGPFQNTQPPQDHLRESKPSRLEPSADSLVSPSRRSSSLESIVRTLLNSWKS